MGTNLIIGFEGEADPSVCHNSIIDSARLRFRASADQDVRFLTVFGLNPGLVSRQLGTGVRRQLSWVLYKNERAFRFLHGRVWAH